MRPSLSFSALALCAATFACPATAQVETLPHGQSSAEGASSRHVPLRYTPARIQCGYSAMATGWSSPKVITKLSARADVIAYVNKPFQVVMQVLLSSDGADTLTTSTKWSSNHGSDVTVFMAKKAFHFAAFARGTTRRNFSIELKGDRPFLARKPTLLVDWSTYSATNQQHSDFYVDAAISGGYYSSYGIACNSTTFYAYAGDSNIGAKFTTHCYSRNIGDGVVMWLSPRRTQTSLGGGCTVYADPFAPGAIINPAPVLTTSVSGYASFNWGVVPVHMAGRRLYAQAFAFDSKGNSRWSRGNDIHFGERRATSHRYNYGVGSTRFDPDKDTSRYGWAGTAIVFKIN